MPRKQIIKARERMEYAKVFAQAIAAEFDCSTPRPTRHRNEVHIGSVFGDENLIVGTPQGDVQISVDVSPTSVWVYCRFADLRAPLTDAQKMAARAVRGNEYSGKMNCYLGGASNDLDDMLRLLEYHLGQINKTYTPRPRYFASPYARSRPIWRFEYKGEQFAVVRTKRANGKNATSGWTLVHGPDRVPVAATRPSELIDKMPANSGATIGRTLERKLASSFKRQPAGYLIDRINDMRDKVNAERIVRQ